MANRKQDSQIQVHDGSISLPEWVWGIEGPEKPHKALPRAVRLSMVEARKLAEEAWDSKEYADYVEKENAKWLAKEQSIKDEEAARKLMYEVLPMADVLPEIVVS